MLEGSKACCSLCPGSVCSQAEGERPTRHMHTGPTYLPARPPMLIRHKTHPTFPPHTCTHTWGGSHLQLSSVSWPSSSPQSLPPGQLGDECHHGLCSPFFNSRRKPFLSCPAPALSSAPPTTGHGSSSCTLLAPPFSEAHAEVCHPDACPMSSEFFKGGGLEILHSEDRTESRKETNGCNCVQNIQIAVRQRLANWELEDKFLEELPEAGSWFLYQFKGPDLGLSYTSRFKLSGAKLFMFTQADASICWYWIGWYTISDRRDDQGLDGVVCSWELRGLNGTIGLKTIVSVPYSNKIYRDFWQHYLNKVWMTKVY